MSVFFAELLDGAAPQASPVRLRAKVLAREHRKMRAELVEIRRKNGLTQLDVAKLMDISQQAVNKMERYDSDLKLSTLRRYANAVGALIEHKVTRDTGESTRLAHYSQWESVGGIPLPSSTRVTVSSTVPAGSGPWTSKRTDFALSA